MAYLLTYYLFSGDLSFTLGEEKVGELASLKNQGKREIAKRRNWQAPVKISLPGQKCWREERRGGNFQGFRGLVALGKCSGFQGQPELAYFVVRKETTCCWPCYEHPSFFPFRDWRDWYWTCPGLPVLHCQFRRRCLFPATILCSSLCHAGGQARWSAGPFWPKQLLKTISPQQSFPCSNSVSADFGHDLA